MAAAKKTEKSFISEAYGLESHAKLAPCTYGVAEVVSDYNPYKMSSFRVFTAQKGSIYQNPIIWVEQMGITLIFICFAVPMYIYFNKKAGAVGEEDQSMRKWVDSQEGRMRQFAMIMTTLASLLLSFYTAMAVARWWVIRTVGVGGIKAAAMELEMIVSQMVTQETKVLQAIRRYARTSLVLIFLWRRKSLGTMKEQLLAHNLLDDDEVNKLEKLRGQTYCLHEAIWAWQTAIICTLWREGKIKSEPLLKKLMEKCADGRAAVQCIHTHLAVKIPMQYVHLLGLLVKMHNVVLSVIMGILFGAAVRNGQTIICVQLVGRTLLLPVLFNAILLINCELSDPFGGSVTDFPGFATQTAIEKDAKGLVQAAGNMPTWMARRNSLKFDPADMNP